MSFRNQFSVAAQQQQLQAGSSAALYSPWLGLMAGAAPAAAAAPPAPQPLIDRAAIQKLRQSEPRRVLAPAPDLVVPIVAWRAWKVESPNGALGLYALGCYGEWPAKKPMVAQCRGTGDFKLIVGSHPSPARDCQCGLWAFRDLDLLLEAADGYNPRVLGQVYLWGRVIECENGFRAQYGYPKELWLLDNSLEQLGYIYNVPVRSL